MSEQLAREAKQWADALNEIAAERGARIVELEKRLAEAQADMRAAILDYRREHAKGEEFEKLLKRAQSILAVVDAFGREAQGFQYTEYQKETVTKWLADCSPITLDPHAALT